MSKRVYKYPVPFDRQAKLELTGPIVKVGIQHDHGATMGSAGGVFIWAEAGVHPPRERTFEVFGTGHEIPSGMQHIGSAVDSFVSLVWHVYEPKS